MARHNDKKQQIKKHYKPASSSKSNPVDPRDNARVKKITNITDAGFTGQDAFQLGDDEILLNGGA